MQQAQRVDGLLSGDFGSRHAGKIAPDSSYFLWRLRHNTARPDIVGTDQPQPVDPLRVGQVCRAGRFGVHEAPRGAPWINWRVWATRFATSFRDAPLGVGPLAPSPRAP